MTKFLRLIGILLFLCSNVYAQALDRTHVNYRNPLQHGAECTDTTLAATTTAVDAGSDTETVILTKTNRAKVVCTWELDGAVTVSEKVNLHIPSGVAVNVTANQTWTGSLSVGYNATAPIIIDNGIVLTLPCNKIVAGNYPLFGGSGTVACSDTAFFSASWTGVKCDNSTDDTLALTKAVAALPSDAGTLVLPTGTCLLDDMSITTQVNLRGQGIDQTVLKGTGGAGTHVLSYAGTDVDYVSVRDLTINGDDLKDAALVIDGASTFGQHLLNVKMLGAVVDTWRVGPTLATQVSELICENCWFLSANASQSQVYINSSNVVNLQFIGGAIGGGAPYGVFCQFGSFSFHNFTFAGPTTADIHFATESCVVRSSGYVHSESTGKLLNAPPHAAVADYQGQSSVLDGVNHTIIPPGDSITYGQGRGLEIRSSFFGGNVTVTSPATVFATGPITFSSGKGFVGTGIVKRWLSATDPVSVDSTGANSPHAIINRLGLGTALTSNLLNGEIYLPNNRGLRWTNNAGTGFGGALLFGHIDQLTNTGTVDLTSSNGTDPLAVVFVNMDNGTSCIFGLQGGGEAVTEISDVGSVCSISVSTASSTNIYWDTDHYELENLTGAARNYTLFFLSHTP